MKKLDTVLFDLDGTLIDTNPIIIKSYQHAFKTHFPQLDISEKTIIEDIGPPLETIFRKYTDDAELIDTTIQTYLSYYRKHEHDLFKLYPGVRSTLELLKKNGIKIAIVTSKFLESANPSVEHFNLNPYFDVFISLDQVKHPKPDPEPVLLALKKLNSTDKAIMIGDNPSDIQAGKNAGILTAGVAWSIKGKRVLLDEHPDYLLENMHDILDIIKKESGA